MVSEQAGAVKVMDDACLLRCESRARERSLLSLGAERWQELTVLGIYISGR